MNLAGLSGHSNGVANLVLDKESSVAEEFYRLNDVDNIRMHPLVPDLASNAVAIADGFLSAKDRLFADSRALTMDRRQMIEEILRSVLVTSPADRQVAREKLRQTIDKERALLAWFDALPDPPPAKRWSPQPDVYGNDGFLLSVRADRWGIANIADAVRFVANVLCLDEGRIAYNLPCVHQPAAEFRRAPKQPAHRRMAREIRRVAHQGAKILHWPLRSAGCTRMVNAVRGLWWPISPEIRVALRAVCGLATATTWQALVSRRVNVPRRCLMALANARVPARTTIHGVCAPFRGHRLEVLVMSRSDRGSLIRQMSLLVTLLGCVHGITASVRLCCRPGPAEPRCRGSVQVPQAGNWRRSVPVASGAPRPCSNGSKAWRKSSPATRAACRKPHLSTSVQWPDRAR